MSDLLAKLNPEQRSAVTCTEGPLLVLAGAGTGKTRVITVRIAHLVARGVSPESVLAVTFTNKAAREMRERLGALIGPKKAALPFVGTFHAFCADVLRTHGALVGLARSFTISDGSDQLALLRGVLRGLQVEGATLQPGEVQARISLLKSRLVGADAYLSGAADETEELVGRAFQRYEEELGRARSIDFDDLLLRTVQLLRRDDGPLPLFRKRFRYVLVDEYQDTNAPQYEIVRAIAGEHRNLCVVGDDDQSIYGWRGADVKRILSFEKDFPGAKVVRLETNYRSTVPILRAANRVISNNSARHPKELRSALGSGDPLQLVLAENETEEADHVAREIATLVAKGVARFGDFAVLFRTGPQARAYEEQFRARQIPYVLVGGRSFFDRKEVRDVMALVKLLVQPDDELAFARIANTPPRGLGAKSLERVFAHAAERGIPLEQAFEEADGIAGVTRGGVTGVTRGGVTGVTRGGVTGVTKAAAAGGRDLCRLLRTVREAQGLTVPARIERVIEAVGYRGEVERLYPDPLERASRWAAVEEVIELARKVCGRKKGASLEKFLQVLALEQEDDGPEEDSTERRSVTLMTLHSAKGLEYPRVYLVGLEEGILPHKRSVAEGNVEEERRLMYVGITRAQRNLTLCHTKARTRYGRADDSLPSRFLFELKQEAPPADWQRAVRALQAGKSVRAASPRKKKAGKKGARRRVRR